MNILDRYIVIIAVAVVGGLALPTEIQAQGPCVTCKSSGCAVVFEDGWYQCSNVFDGCLLQGSGCQGGFALLPDGRMVPELARETGGPDTEPLSTRYVLAIQQEKLPVGAEVWYRRACDDIVVERHYTVEVAASLRAKTRVLSL
ncbi:MAG: hypothetical protein ACE5HT_15320 [Gemmatimonadales bacterium]